MKRYVVELWNVVMEHDHNQLKHVGDIQVRHIVLQVLAWMWCIIFAMSTGSITVFGVSVVAHALVIAGIVVTVATFQTARIQPNRFITLARGAGGEHE